MGEGSDTIKNIGVSVAGSLAGGKVAEKLHLGRAGGLAGSIGGSLLANEGHQKFKENEGK